ncbi:alpha/beta hydrolase [Sphingomonas tabacisoli]|uniref:Alpha/beta hydrolase n=1 Tax=Sphingomonas tabacisoli TaxID=2249466 RepID=A0ABW4I3D4_9SPHN
MITRHFVQVGNRRVHYRRTGSGPPLLMAHQSPRSSAEFEPLMTRWSSHFTCIAPDTPGFGQSDPLENPAPEIEDFADAVAELLDALGLSQVGAYGLYSGATILIAAARRHPERFSAVAANGYAAFRPEERAIFGERYTSPFKPTDYGEHLTWAWNRMLEQNWFFPWYDARDQARLPSTNDDPVALHHAVMDLLASGDAYRLGYGAVLRAQHQAPGPDEPTPPVLLTAAESDPFHKHLGRLRGLPANWRVQDGTIDDATIALCLQHLKAHPAPSFASLPEAADEGFVLVEAGGFKNLIHWKGDRESDTLALHAPGRSLAVATGGGELAIDLPGHGLSGDWRSSVKPSLADWVAVIAAAVEALGAKPAVVTGDSWSALLAIDVAKRLGAGRVEARRGWLPVPEAAPKWAEQVMFDARPDRFGQYLVAAWSAIRAWHFFWPWFEASAANAIPFDPADVTPDRLRIEHLAIMRARKGRQLLTVLAQADRDALFRGAGVEIDWPLPAWARKRTDVWKPPSTR